MVNNEIAERFFSSKLGDISRITPDEFFNSKINGKLTHNEIKEDMLKTENEINIREKWERKLEGIYKKKGLIMHTKGVYDLPIYTLENLNNIRNSIINDDMHIGLIQGNPASGKSTAAICLIACALDETFNLDRIAFTREDCLKILNYIRSNVMNLRGRGLIFVFDEGTEALFGGDSNSTEIKNMIKTLSVIREANPLILINTTSFKKINPTIRDEFIRFMIRTPKKGLIEFRNKSNIDRIIIPARGAVRYPKPNLKEYTPKIDGVFWEGYRKRKHLFLGGNTNKGIQSYKDALNIIGMLKNPLDKLVLLLKFEGFDFSEMLNIRRNDIDIDMKYLNGRVINNETKELLIDFLTYHSPNKRVTKIFPKMGIRNLENIYNKIIMDFRG